jgi:hypothetical protein
VTRAELLAVPIGSGRHDHQRSKCDRNEPGDGERIGKWREPALLRSRTRAEARLSEAGLRGDRRVVARTLEVPHDIRLAVVPGGAPPMVHGLIRGRRMAYRSP